MFVLPKIFYQSKAEYNFKTIRENIEIKLEYKWILKSN